MANRLFILILSATLFACSDDTLPKYSKLSGLRVVALKASAPEVDVGGTTNLEAIVSWPELADQTLAQEVTYCLDPGVSLGANPTCEGSTSRQVLVSSSPLSLAAPHFTEIVSLGTLDTATVIDTATLAKYPDHTQYNGVSVLVVYRVTASDGSEQSVFRTVLVSDASKTQKNQNPSLLRLTLDAAELNDAFPSTSGTVAGAYQSNEVGTAYTYRFADGSARDLNEELLTTWFSTEGKLKFTRTLNEETNVFTFAEASEARAAKTFIAVVRDGRGGVDYRINKGSAQISSR